MKKIKILKYGAIALAAVAVILLMSNSNSFFPVEEQVLAPPLKVPEPVEYETYEVQLGRIENKIQVRAFFQPLNKVDTSFSNRDGYLKKMYVQVGDRVEKGEILAELDVDNLERDLARQRIHLEELKDQYQHLLDISKIDYSVNQIKLKEAEEDLKSQREVGESIARLELSKLENQLSIQRQNYDRMVLDYSYRIASAQREIELAELELNNLETELNRATLRSPINGKVTFAAHINEGEYVDSYKTIATIADVRDLALEYRGKEHAVLYPGMDVTVTYQGQEYQGEVISTPRQVSAEEFEQMKELVSFSAEGLPDDCESGDSAMVEALLYWADDVIVLPKKLVHEYSGRSLVKVLEQGIVNEVDVSVGLQTASECEITSGLEQGDLVVE